MIRNRYARFDLVDQTKINKFLNQVVVGPLQILIDKKNVDLGSCQAESANFMKRVLKPLTILERITLEFLKLKIAEYEALETEIEVLRGELQRRSDAAETLSQSPVRNRT